MNPSNYISGYIVLDIVDTIFIALLTITNLGIFMCMIKLYTEILKVKALTKEELEK